LTGDESFSFTAGELETLSRLGVNVKVVLFNNQSYGWIRASMLFRYGPKYFTTEFKPVDYMKIAEGFGLTAFKAERSEELDRILREAFKLDESAFVGVIVEPEDKLVSPVPSWARRAKELGLRYVY
jgi:acetolactate synthase-1/2/3 large subunit